LGREQQVRRGHHHRRVVFLPPNLVGADGALDHDERGCLRRFAVHLLGGGAGLVRRRVVVALEPMRRPELGESAARVAREDRESPGLGELVIGSPHGGVEQAGDEVTGDGVGTEAADGRPPVDGVEGVHAPI
jgi:hypothetical protein